MKIAENYDNEVDNTVSALTSILSPLMIVALALVIGTIVIALFLPLIGRDRVNRLRSTSLSRIHAVESTPHPALSRKGRGNFAPQAASVAFTER